MSLHIYLHRLRSAVCANKRWRFALPAYLLCSVSAISGGAQMNSGENPQNHPRDVQPVQAGTESLDLKMYSLIRREGMDNSHVMEYASALMDGIGQRLTGSPGMTAANNWTRDQLIALGCVNVHLEDWGELGVGWQQFNTWMRMTKPVPAVLMAQTAAWSPSTNGPVTGSVVKVVLKDEGDFGRYKGTLTGKIVLLANYYKTRDPEAPADPRRYTEGELVKQSVAPWEDTKEGLNLFLNDLFHDEEFREKIGNFLASEHVLAVIELGHNFSLQAAAENVIYNDNLQGLGWFIWKHDNAMKVPLLITTAGGYGRMSRLLDAGIPLELQLNADVAFTGDHQHGFNTIAEIPGTDPTLKDQVVMFGAHLDSNPGATGATDNGAGVAVALEITRILTALHVQPRRTIRIALWSGEEEGLLGSEAYVSQHFGSIPYDPQGREKGWADFARPVVGPITTTPEQKTISAYFNLDNGSGKIRGIYSEGNAGAAAIFNQWIEPLKDLGATTVTMRGTALTDHTYFNLVGIPAFQFIQDPLDYEIVTHHSNLDDYEHLSAADLRQAAVVEATFIYDAAMRDEMLPRLPLQDSSADPQKGKGTTPLQSAAHDAEAADHKQ